MTLHQLRSFVAVARLRSVSRAADVVHLTQPAVSKHIRALEERLGAKLVFRAGRSVQLTDAGEALHEYASRILGSLEEAEAAIGEMRGLRRGCLRVGAATTIGVYMLPAFLGEFKHQYPAVDISLTITNKEQIVRSLLRGEIDLGFVGPPIRPSTLAREEFLTDDLVLIVAPTHRFARRPSVLAEELKDEVFIVRERGSGTREIVEEEFARVGVALRQGMELGSTEAIKQAVAADLGVSVISRHAITLEAMTGRLCALGVRDLKLRRRLYITYSKGRPLAWAAQEFRDLVLGKREGRTRGAGG